MPEFFERFESLRRVIPALVAEELQQPAVPNLGVEEECAVDDLLCAGQRLESLLALEGSYMVDGIGDARECDQCLCSARSDLRALVIQK